MSYPEGHIYTLDPAETPAQIGEDSVWAERMMGEQEVAAPAEMTEQTRRVLDERVVRGVGGTAFVDEGEARAARLAKFRDRVENLPPLDMAKLRSQLGHRAWITAHNAEAASVGQAA
jgi:hypothetical protein